MQTPHTYRDLTESPTALRAEFARRLFLTEEQQLQEALTTARTSAENAIMMGEEEAQTAVKVRTHALLEGGWMENVCVCVCVVPCSRDRVLT